MGGKNSGRKLKVSTEEVLNDIDGKHKTMHELATKHEVTRRTIQNKIKRGRQAGYPIIHGTNGIILIDKTWLEKECNAIELEDYSKWIVGHLKALHYLAQPIQPLLPQMKRTLSINYSKEERHKLAVDCTRVAALLTFLEVQEEQE